MPSRKPTTLRGLLAQVADEEATVDRVREVVAEALSGETTRVVECPECGNTFKAKLPDTAKRLESVMAVLESTEGKLGQQAMDTGISVTIVRPPLPPE